MCCPVRLSRLLTSHAPIARHWAESRISSSYPFIVACDNTSKLPVERHFNPFAHIAATLPQEWHDAALVVRDPLLKTEVCSQGICSSGSCLDTLSLLTEPCQERLFQDLANLRYCVPISCFKTDTTIATSHHLWIGYSSLRQPIADYSLPFLQQSTRTPPRTLMNCTVLRTVTQASSE